MDIGNFDRCELVKTIFRGGPLDGYIRRVRRGCDKIGMLASGGEVAGFGQIARAVDVGLKDGRPDECDLIFVHYKRAGNRQFIFDRSESPWVYG